MFCVIVCTSFFLWPYCYHLEGLAKPPEWSASRIETDWLAFNYHRSKLHWLPNQLCYFLLLTMSTSLATVQLMSWALFNLSAVLSARVNARQRQSDMLYSKILLTHKLSVEFSAFCFSAWLMNSQTKQRFSINYIILCFIDTHVSYLAASCVNRIMSGNATCRCKSLGSHYKPPGVNTSCQNENMPRTTARCLRELE